ncbi:MAG TPA: phosphatidylserine decarboxylase, partial [Spirochaetia bacterium]|nr:phosphatidylserine decarboxylase [Spirochaetia bacterium]
MRQEGYWYGLPLVLISGGLLGFWLRERSFFLLVCAFFFLVLAFLALNFFRDPERPIPTLAQAIISPADGRVVQVIQENYEGCPVCRVSIFMSPLDVHVNRAPIAGVVKDVSYRKGAFRVAREEAASVENEQNVFTLEGEQGRIVVKQIAGILARRIVFWKRPGDSLARGERVGLIKFGSRVDVLLDRDAEIQVKPGDRVKGGATVLAVLPVTQPV